MKLTVISVTEKGRRLSERIEKLLPEHQVRRCCFYRHADKNSRSFPELSGLVAEIWSDTDALVFVCACGIAVRSIAPHIRSKLSDPAVIVTDDCGKFIIPVLSGHIGGANALAVRLAEAIGGQAAVTTATDIGGRFSPDSFAAANGLILADPKAAKEIAAAVLDGERIGLVSEYEYRNAPPELAAGELCRCGLYIGGKCGTKPFPVTLELYPKNIVLGIGCRRGISSGAVERTVLTALGSAGISPGRVCGAASVDIKSNEEGLLDFCRKYGIELTAFTAEELMEVNGDFSSSEFVRAVTGVDNICERSAVRAGGGRLVLRKFSQDGVTAAAAEKPVIIDFERKML